MVFICVILVCKNETGHYGFVVVVVNLCASGFIYFAPIFINNIWVCKFWTIQTPKKPHYNYCSIIIFGHCRLWNLLEKIIIVFFCFVCLFVILPFATSASLEKSFSILLLLLLLLVHHLTSLLLLLLLSLSINLLEFISDTKKRTAVWKWN